LAGARSMEWTPDCDHIRRFGPPEMIAVARRPIQDAGGDGAGEVAAVGVKDAAVGLALIVSVVKQGYGGVSLFLFYRGQGCGQEWHGQNY
jgi:hypothetical protein